MTPDQSSTRMMEICSRVPVIPVIEIDDAEQAQPLARALIDGGLNVLEITLRTPSAIPAIRQLARMPDCIVGAGSLLTTNQVEQALDAGAEFGVSPGSSPNLIESCSTRGLPFLPGAATATEIMGLLEQGFKMLKYFPAEEAGGAKALKALSGPLPSARFCPTGGIGAANARDYLSLENVMCVGGSWVASRESIKTENWEAIRRLAAEAVELHLA